MAIAKTGDASLKMVVNDYAYALFSRQLLGSVAAIAAWRVPYDGMQSNVLTSARPRTASVRLRDLLLGMCLVVVRIAYKHRHTQQS